MFYDGHLFNFSIWSLFWIINLIRKSKEQAIDPRNKKLAEENNKWSEPGIYLTVETEVVNSTHLFQSNLSF